MKKLLLLIAMFTAGGDVNVDHSVWNNAAGMREGFELTQPTNEFVHVAQAVGIATDSTWPYEKAAIIGQALQNDPSSATISRDMVGTEGRCIVGVAQARCWGGYFEASGLNGYMVGMEIGMRNRGIGQPLLDQLDSKVVLSLVAGEGIGDNPPTAALNISGGGSQFYSGIVMDQFSFVDPQGGSAITIRGTPFKVTAGGDLLTRDLRPQAFYPKFYNQPARPALKAGELAMWGDTSTGVTYLLFFDGGNYQKVRLQ